MKAPEAGGPPRGHRRLLRWLVTRRDRASVEAELEELWRLRTARSGRDEADRWYRRQVRAFALRGAGRMGRRADRERAGPLDLAALDLRAAARRLGRHPASTVTALLALTLGIGAGATVFSVVDGVVFRPLPFPEPDRLVHVSEVMTESGARMAVAPPAYLAWNAATLASVEGVAVMTPEAIDLIGNEGAEHLDAARVGRSFFSVLRVDPALGRAFTDEEDRAGGPDAVVLSHGLWIRRFGGDPGVLGQEVRLGGRPHTVVGVMPRGFDHPGGTEIWLPLAPILAGMEDVWGALFLDAVARLRTGGTLEEARADLDGVLDAHPGAARWDAAVAPLQDHLVGEVRGPLLLLLGAVTLVILVACANVGGLLLTQAAGRRRELAVRTALGASRGRLAAALLTESTLLAGVAGLVGIALAAVGLQAVLTLVPFDLPRVSEIALSTRVIAFAAAATVTTGLIAGVPPMLRLRTEAGRALGGGSGHGDSPSGSRSRSVLVVAQVAVSVVLLAGAGLLGRSFLHLVRQDVGFDSRGLAAVKLDLPTHRYPTDRELTEGYVAFRAAAASIPGVSGAAVTRNLPLSGRTLRAPVYVDDETRINATHVSASPGYLELLGIRLAAGRTFTEDDERSGRPVAVISESLSAALFRGGDPVGRTFTTQFGGETLEVVGVVADVRHASPGIPPDPILYRPLGHWPSRGVHVVVRSTRPAADVLAALRAAVEEARSGQAVIELATLDALLVRTVAGPRFYAVLLGSFAGLALFLALLGLHGLLTRVVLERRREIGIRMALGADARRVRRSVVGRAVRLSSVGVVLGLAGAWSGGRLIEGLLFEVGPNDPVTLLAVGALMLLTAGAAAWPIARRATHVDPVAVMRG